MTALSEYEKLESVGLWRDTADAQRREVVVSFGDTSLIITDSRKSTVLAHWSLPATVRLNPGEMPALYAPGEDAEETLELNDETMIAAIDKVNRLIEARKPHPGRLRLGLLGGALAVVLALGIFWMPGELVRHTASVVPFAKRQEIGLMVLADLERLSGAPCNQGQGPDALTKLGARLLGDGPDFLIVLPRAVSGTRHLPGRITIIGHDLVEDHETPEVAAGHILAERLRAEAKDPLVNLLEWAGLRTTFRLLTTGELPADAIAGYGRALLETEVMPVDDTALLDRFEIAQVRSTPYAYAQDVSGETVLGLIEADPFRSNPPENPVLVDDDWVALQGICGT